ncbi:hypothetical protein [Fuchsiella alkaliacetigena]|uniref:hypothetical protein n=1 Tax=Fuchsiella alkaliacetigena TaxID=957042 RepID=UPI00200B900D|nr:hypothetical protein [Fuchsiella alkaliacetigena]MCK8826080.1 hypothetical protein [Fuchsiella alkaliacetigena]
MEETLCERCKNELFSQANRKLCEKCAEQLFEKVKGFIAENPDNSIKEIAEQTEVEKKYIKKWIREGRLELMTPEAKKEREKALDFQKQFADLKETEQKEAQEPSQEKEKGRFHTRK